MAIQAAADRSIATSLWYPKCSRNSNLCNVRDSFDHSIILLWHSHNLSLQQYKHSLLAHSPAHGGWLMALEALLTLSVRDLNTGRHSRIPPQEIPPCTDSLLPFEASIFCFLHICSHVHDRDSRLLLCIGHHVNMRSSSVPRVHCTPGAEAAQTTAPHWVKINAVWSAVAPALHLLFTSVQLKPNKCWCSY